MQVIWMRYGEIRKDDLIFLTVFAPNYTDREADYHLLNKIHTVSNVTARVLQASPNSFGNLNKAHKAQNDKNDIL